ANVCWQRRLQVAAEPEWQHFCGVHALAITLREVARPIDVDYACDLARLAGVLIAIELLYVTGYAEEQCEMPTGRSACDTDAIGIDVVLLRVGSQPADRRLGVVHG